MDICSECIAWRSLTSLYDWRLVIGETLTIILPEECKQDCHMSLPTALRNQIHSWYNRGRTIVEEEQEEQGEEHAEEPD